MNSADAYISYSIAVFVVVLITGCILNLLEQHYVFQLLGIAFFFTYSIFRSFSIFQNNFNVSPREVYIALLPMLVGISACLISMVLGFWIFPHIRKKAR